MGTSSAYGGPGGGTPLIPSWLGTDGADSPTTPPNNPDSGESDIAPAAPNQPPLPAAPTDTNRFSGARSNFTRFAHSDGTDRASLGRAVSKYVSISSGGTKQAVQRMGSARGAGARLVGFLSDVQDRGVREALKSLKLDSLAGRPIDEVFIGLADYICPVGGTVDEGIAREAFIETIIELSDLGISDLDALTSDQMQTVFEIYATHAIEARLCNDIGTKIITMPSNVNAAQRVQEQLRDFIRNCVSDALTATRTEMQELTQEHVQEFVDSVYERSFEVLQAVGEAEAER